MHYNHTGDIIVISISIWLHFWYKNFSQKHHYVLFDSYLADFCNPNHLSLLDLMIEFLNPLTIGSGQ